MKRKWILAVALAVVGIAVAVVFRDHLRPSPQTGLRSVRGRSGLVVQSPDGKSWDLAKSGEKVALVHFWATWCKPCVEELPELAAFSRNNSGRREVKLYAIAVDKEGWAAVQPFLEKNGVKDFPVFLDPGGKVAERFGTTMYPETYILNSNGRVVEKVAQAISWTNPEVQAFIEKIIAGAD
jgi:thiol-disulfide isomerase/thioredoxin